MTLSDLGNIGELVGGIAVVISLLYLEVRIRHSSQISKFDADRFHNMDRDLQGRYQQCMERFLGFEAVRSGWSRQGKAHPQTFQDKVESGIRAIRAAENQ